MRSHNDQIQVHTLEEHLSNVKSSSWVHFLKRRGHKQGQFWDKYRLLEPKQKSNRAMMLENMYLLLIQKWKLLKSKMTKCVYLDEFDLSEVKYSSN